MTVQTRPTAVPDTEPEGARIYDFAAARARREARAVGAIPADVWAEVEAANHLFEELEAEGRRLVLDDGRLDGRLIIDLCDLDGRLLRSVPAADVVSGAVHAADVLSEPAEGDVA